MQWAIEDVLTKRLAIVQLHELHLGSQEEIAAAFGISITSVYNTLRRFAAAGPAGLLGATRGPKSRWKITAQVRGKILQAFLKEGIVEYESIRQRLAAGGGGGQRWQYPPGTPGKWIGPRSGGCFGSGKSRRAVSY